MSDEEDIVRQIEKREEQRLKDEIEDIEEILEDRDDIYDSVVSELDEEIRRQKNRLESAQSSDEPRIRGILKELYRERREEYRAHWRDRQSWLEKKMDLEEQRDQLGDLDGLLE